MPRRMKSKKAPSQVATRQASSRSDQIAEKVKEIAKENQLDINENVDEMQLPNVEAEQPQELPEKATAVENEADEQEKQPENVPKKKKEKNKKVSAIQIEANRQAAAERFAEYRREEAEKVKNMNDEERTAYKGEKAAKRKENRIKKQYGLIFPVVRTRKYLKQYLGVPHKKGALKHRKANLTVRNEASIYTAAVLEYMAAEVLEISGNVAIEKKRRTIKPRDILLAIRDDAEINKLISKNAIFCQTGIIPKQIPTVLLKPYQKSAAWTKTVAAQCYSMKPLTLGASSKGEGSVVGAAGSTIGTRSGSIVDSGTGY